MTKNLLAILYEVLSISLIFAKPSIVNVYHWSEYLPEEILQQFTQETGIQVNSSSYDSNEALYTKIKTIPSHGYDVIIPASYAVDRMIREDMLEPLDKSKLLNMSSLDKVFLNQPYDMSNQYSLPYLFSASGLVVNSHYHDPSQFYRWGHLWDPSLRSQLLLLDDSREIFSIALLRLGFSPNTKDSGEIYEAYKKLRQLLVNVRAFNSEGIIDLYASEELTVGMGWNGDVYRVNQSNQKVHFIYPQEGYLLSIDSLVIPKGAQHREEAYALINFLLRPDIAAAVSLATGYGTPSIKARDYLPAEFLSNATVYPKADTLKKGIVQLSAGEQAALYEQYWEWLKIEG